MPYSMQLEGGPLDGELVISIGAPPAWLEVKAKVWLDPDGATVVGLDKPEMAMAFSHCTLYYEFMGIIAQSWRYVFRRRDEGATLCGEREAC